MLMVNKPSKTCAHMAHIILLLPYALLKASKASIGRCLVLRPYIYRGSNLDFEGVYLTLVTFLPANSCSERFTREHEQRDRSRECAGGRRSSASGAT